MLSQAHIRQNIICYSVAFQDARQVYTGIYSIADTVTEGWPDFVLYSLQEQEAEMNEMDSLVCRCPEQPSWPVAGQPSFLCCSLQLGLGGKRRVGFWAKGSSGDSPTGVQILNTCKKIDWRRKTDSHQALEEARIFSPPKRTGPWATLRLNCRFLTS